MICTNKEQSLKLLELGINPNTADMCLTWVNNVWNEVVGNFEEIFKIQTISHEEQKYLYDDDKEWENNKPNVIPAWSLCALLKLIPPIILESYKDKTFKLEVKYKDYCGIYTDNPIDTTFNALVYLIQNNLIML